MSNLTHEQLSQIRDCKARLTLGYQTVKHLVSMDKPDGAIIAALNEMGRNGIKELLEAKATGERV